MKKVLLIGSMSLASLMLIACSKADNPETTVEIIKEKPAVALTSGLYLKNMDTNVKPGDDFNAYVNGAWMSKTDIPADKASYGAGYIVHEQSQTNIKSIIDESSQGDFSDGSDEQKVGDLFFSFTNRDNRNQLAGSPLQKEFKKIAAITNYDQLAVYFAAANKLGYGTPFSLGQYVDFKDPNSYMMYTWQAGLGLPDREYYFNEDEKSSDIRSKYVSHIENMFTLSGIESSKQAAKTVMALETLLASNHMKKEKTRDMVALYNKIPLAELTSIMADFNWQGYLTEAGINDIDGVVITQLEYQKALNDIIKDTSLKDWQLFLQWGVINANSTTLSQAFDDEHFSFYSQVLRGVETPLPDWRRGVSLVNNHLGEVVGKVYVKRHFPPAAKEKMLALVNNLIDAYEVNIKSLDWMSEETKLQALDKLSKFTPKIGYPDIWKDYSQLAIDKNDLVGNIERAKLVVYQQNLVKQKGPVQKHEWAMTPQTVNAYYNPPLNEIVFPAAILQPPYFDLNAEDAVNYGAIGAVIGHEIGHGFDDSGSTFDGDGVLRNWWTDQDKERFKERTGVLVAQYDSFKVFDDLNVNGTFTLGENIGDLGGLSIALQAYKKSLHGQKSPEMDGFTGEQRVFLGYGQSWLRKSREEALRVQVKTDPHSPSQFRVNGVVRNIPEFYTLFDVKEGDALYIPPAERVKIW
jgi:putative endopeptidase